MEDETKDKKPEDGPAALLDGIQRVNEALKADEPQLEPGESFKVEPSPGPGIIERMQDAGFDLGEERTP